MSESKYTKPDQNIVFAMVKSICELPTTFIHICNDKAYSNHTTYAKWEITLLKTFIKNLHYKQLLLLQPNKDIKSQLSKVKSKYGKDWNNFGKELDNFPGAVWLVEKPERTPTDPVILFYHGGAYLFQFQCYTHLIFLINLAKKLPDFSILLVDYPLSPHPAPLMYNLELWEKLFNEEGLQNVITVGDSAGAHLILSSLAAIKAQPTKTPLPKLFKHVLISPWVNASTASLKPIISTNPDILDPKRSYGWSEIFIHNEKPVDVSTADYGDLLADKALITVGELEMLYEPIEKFGVAYNIPILVEKQGIHDQITMEKFLGYKEGDIFDSIVEFALE